MLAIRLGCMLLALSLALGDEPAPVPLELPERPRTLVDDVVDGLDPAADGWTTEVLTEQAAAQLSLVARLLESRSPIGESDLLDLAVSRVGFVNLLPGHVEDVLDDGVFRVGREAGGKAGASGYGPLADSLRRLGDLIGHHEERRFTFKIYRVQPTRDGFATVALLEGVGRSADDGTQISTGWAVEWTLPGNGRPALMRRIVSDEHEHSTVRAPGGRLFADATAAVLGSDPSFPTQVLPGIDYWAERIPRAHGMSIFGHNGIAVGDVNGDGLEDLYVCDQGGLPNRLYVQRPDGTARDAAAEAGVDWLDGSSSALLLDLDNDGDQDLVVATRVTILFAENDGAGRYRPRQGIGVVREPYSMAAADYDLDGDLDVYVTGYGAGAPDDRSSVAFEGTVPVPYHDARNGGRNALLRNEGDFRFTDATAAAGLDGGNDRFSFAASWEDYDDDGDPDLYVANDFGRNNLYRNDAGRFTDAAAEAGVEDIAAGMSVSWGDYDRDGRMDLYVGNMYSSAGKRIAYQRRFGEGRSGDDVAMIRRTAGGNTLFRNLGDGTFQDTGGDTGVKMGRWAWSSPFIDLNNDGWEDLLVTNGFFSSEDTDDL